MYCHTDATVRVVVRFWADEIEPDWVGVVVERSTVGICGSGEVLTDEPLLPPPGSDFAHYELDFPVPDVDVTYHYAARGLTEEGELEDMTGEVYRPTWFCVEACAEDALMLRGRLRDIDDPWRLGIDICEGYCWDICPGGATVGIYDVDLSEYAAYVDADVVVNVYGVWDQYWPEFSRGCVNASRFEPVVDCGGAVALERISWGSVKTLHR